MDVLRLLNTSIEKQEFRSFLIGDAEYFVESSDFSMGVGTDVNKILSGGILDDAWNQLIRFNNVFEINRYI